LRKKPRKVYCIDTIDIVDIIRSRLIGQWGTKRRMLIKWTAMKKIPVENTIRLMLAAWMLLATSVVSSTYVHSHQGGNRSHHHNEDKHAFSSLHVSSALHDGYHGDAYLSSGDIHRHGCLTLLGTISYLPIPSRSHVPDSHTNFPIGWDTVVTVSAAPSVRSLAKGPTVDYTEPIAINGVSIGFVCESKQPESSHTDSSSITLLCDRARHERSGVQLA
jgi:hypothetical protein